MSMFFTYILKSKKDSKYYYGHTDDLIKRLDYHNKGKVRSTKSRIPLILHYSEKFDTKSDAYRREKFFKTIAGYRFLKSNGII